MYKFESNFGGQGIDRRSFLRALGIGASTVAVGGLLAGCAPEAKVSVAPSASSSAFKDDGVKAFNFTNWTMAVASGRTLIQKYIDGYDKSHGTTVTSSSYPYGKYLEQLILQIRGGQISGAFQLDISWLTAVGALGKFADLSSFVKDAGYADYALKTGQFDGKQVGLPWTTGAIGMVANSELLEKAKIGEDPKTLEDFEEVLRALKGLGSDVVPYAAMTKVDNLKDIVPWMWAFGSPVVKDDKITVGDEPSIDALIWYKKMYDEGLIGKDLNRVDARALFGQGKVGVYEDAPSARQFVTSNAADKQIGEKLTAFARPLVSGGASKPQALSWGQVICVLEGGEGAFAAAEFARYLSSDKPTAIDYFKGAGTPPTTTGALDDTGFTSDGFAKAFATKITPTAKADPLWKYPKSALIYEALATQVQAVLIDKVTPKAGAEAARQAMQKLID